MYSIKLKSIIIAFALVLPFSAFAQAYNIQPVQIKTRWANGVSPSNVLREYPRPQMERAQWTNLNGLWSYAITGKDAAKPASFNDKILVPYPIESALSGVKKILKSSENLWYKRNFTARPKAGEKVLLHFGAVDWEATVWVNGALVGSHKGGYTAFSFDISQALKAGENELVVKVFDPTDQGYQPHGKQVSNPANIYYTPSSGIWQTVWMESVPTDHVQSLTITPDIDKSTVNIKVKSATIKPVTLTMNGKIFKGKTNTTIAVPVPNAKFWTPDQPHLYNFTATLGNDQVNSYFGMRKVSVAKDSKGMDRIMLNNKPYFNLGTLDQGFWPDGLYTAPTDEALAFDIKAIKAMGFNTIRKHIKVEPARWYYHADKIGMLVWQDMVNPNQGLPEGAKEEFEKESAETLSQLHNYPSITTWVLFNEAWGQYDQERLTKWMKATDPSRIVNGHSGELLYVNDQLRANRVNPYVGADMTDVHAYPDPMNALKLEGKAQVCGEFGGIGVFIPDHQWNTSSAWGYINSTPAAFKAKYTIMNQHLQLFDKQGMSGSIYTQPFDVEGEQNGIMTYDREVVKIPFAELRKIHAPLNPDVLSPNWMNGLEAVSAKSADLTDPALAYSQLFQKYLDGERNPEFLKRLSMMAAQAGDKAGASLAGSAYVAALKTPLSASDMESVTQFAKSTKDAAFKLMLDNEKEFRKVLGDRKYTTNMMNMIFKGEMEPMMPREGKTDWAAIEAKVKPFGAPGEEILLRAKTVAFYNAKDWSSYLPAARVYLEKYGNNLPENERVMFQKAIQDH